MPLSDYEKIQNHLARYCFAVDTASAEEITNLFWEDAVLEFNGHHYGEDEILRCYCNWIENMRDPVEGLRHLIHIPLIEIDGDSAISECYADADAHSRRKGRFIENRAVYRDKLSRRDGEWRFSERRIVWMRGAKEDMPRSTLNDNENIVSSSNT